MNTSAKYFRGTLVLNIVSFNIYIFPARYWQAFEAKSCKVFGEKEAFLEKYFTPKWNCSK